MKNRISVQNLVSFSGRGGLECHPVCLTGPSTSRTKVQDLVGYRLHLFISKYASKITLNQAGIIKLRYYFDPASKVMMVC